MNQMEIQTRFTDIVRNALDDDNIELQPSMTAADVPDWDSVAHVRIMVALEQEFAIRFEGNELTEMVTIGSLLELITRKLHAAPER